MQIISPFLFGISANLDALLIGASYGFRKVRISFRENLIISLITFAGSFLSVGLGKLLEPIFPANITSYVGSVLLILFGGYLLIKAFYHKSLSAPSIKETTDLDASAMEQEQTPADSPADHAPSENMDEEESSGTLTLTEIVILGIMLSMNNIGIGFGTGMAGIAMMPTMIVTLLLSLLFMTLGNRLGEAKWIGSIAKIADPLSGFLLMCLGLVELLK